MGCGITNAAMMGNFECSTDFRITGVEANVKLDRRTVLEKIGSAMTFGLLFHKKQQSHVCELMDRSAGSV